MEKTKELVERLLKAKEAYYNNEAPIMSDSEFDRLEEELKNVDPYNKYFKIVGINVKGSHKMEHSVPMRSCQKAKTVEEVIKWYNRLDTESSVTVMSKIDGLSATCFYKNGKLEYIATRGDGQIGQDITNVAKNIPSIPKELPYNIDIEVRGEIYLSKKSNFPNPENKPRRNIASGIINRKDNIEEAKYLSFISYDYIEYNDFKDLPDILKISSTKFNEKLKALIGLGFYSVSYYVSPCNILGITRIFENYKKQLRDQWEFETDGLVIMINNTLQWDNINSKWEVSHHNHYNIALKPEAESAYTKAESIEWQMSKRGYLIPVLKFDEVTLLDRKITKATLNNFENVVNLKIAYGDKVKILLANDVIPFVDEVENCGGATFAMPIYCPSCGTYLEIEGVHLACKNKDCPEQKVLRIIHWVETLEMDSVSSETIRALYGSVVNNIQDLYELADYKEQILNMNGFGESKVDNLLKQIEKTKTMSIARFIKGLNIDLVGEKAVKKLNINSVEDFLNFDDSQYVIGKNLITYRDENIEDIKKLIDLVNIETTKEMSLDTLKVCMTGKGPKGRKELIQDIENKGYCFVEAINKETNILLCEDVNGNSSKLVKAKKLGITLMSYDDFFKN